MSVLTAWDLLCPLCVCLFFTSYRVKTKKFFATGSLPRFVYGSFQTDPSKEYFENRYPTRTPLKSQAQFAKKKTRKIVMNNSRSRLLNQFLIIVNGFTLTPYPLLFSLPYLHLRHRQRRCLLQTLYWLNRWQVGPDPSKVIFRIPSTPAIGREPPRGQR